MCYIRFIIVYLNNLNHVFYRLLFMSATDEELRYISSLEIDHVTYSLIMLR